MKEESFPSSGIMEQIKQYSYAYGYVKLNDKIEQEMIKHAEDWKVPEKHPRRIFPGISKTNDI